MSNTKKAEVILECIELLADKSENLFPSALIGNTLECQDTTPMRYKNPSFNKDIHLNIDLTHTQMYALSEVALDYFEASSNLEEGFDYDAFSAIKEQYVEEIGQIIDTVGHYEL